MLPFSAKYLYDVVIQSFQRYCLSNNLETWNLRNGIFRCGLQKKIKNCNVFILVYFQQKEITKIYHSSKKLHFGPFLSIFGQTRIFPKTHFCHFFEILDFYFYAEFQKKLLNRFQKKVKWRQWRTDKHEFRGLLLPGSKKFICDIVNYLSKLN